MLKLCGSFAAAPLLFLAPALSFALSILLPPPLLSQTQVAPGSWIQLETPLAEGESLALPGPWDFFWDQELPAKNLSWPRLEQRVEAGRPWRAYRDLSTGDFLPRQGRALFRIRISGLEKGLYSFRVPRIGGRGRILLEQATLCGEEDPRRSGPFRKDFRVGSPDEVWGLVVEVISLRAEGGLLSVPLLERRAI